LKSSAFSASCIHFVTDSIGIAAPFRQVVDKPIDLAVKLAKTALVGGSPVVAASMRPRR